MALTNEASRFVILSTGVVIGTAGVKQYVEFAKKKEIDPDSY